jgi:Uma2 family endonuclease
MAMVTLSRFTTRDYMRLPEGFPAQLVEGLLVRDPAPVPWHQRVARRLLFAIAEDVGQERVMHAPLDLVLDDQNVYQPDILVFDRDVPFRPGTREIETPALVVEVLSPSTAALDRGVKCRRYLAGGVREVWLVDPDSGMVEIRGPGGITRAGPDGVAQSAALDGIAVDLARLFRV